jgi:N-acetylmuramoyl-L-alanine amidase
VLTTTEKHYKRTIGLEYEIFPTCRESPICSESRTSGALLDIINSLHLFIHILLTPLRYIQSRNQWRQTMKLISNVLTLFIIIALAVMMFYGMPERKAARDLSEDDLFCMVQNVYHEARGEDVLGQAAVAHVTLNRVKSPAYPKSVCGVVWQPGQFSRTEDGKSDRLTDLGAIGKAVDIALAVSRGKVKDPTGGSLRYYAHHKVKPAWSNGGYRFIVGEHTFVRLVGR